MQGREGGLTLEYRRVSASEPRWCGWVFVGTSAAAGVAPWVEFTRERSPWSVAVEVMREMRDWMEGVSGLFALSPTLLLLALPFFVGVVIVLWNVRLAVWPRSWMGERVALWGISGASVGMTGWFIGRGMADPDAWGAGGGGAPVGGGGGTGVMGAGVTGWLWWRKRRREVVVTAALYTAYLANGVLCVMEFADDREVGWWLTAAACGGLIGELAAYGVGVGRRGGGAGEVVEEGAEGAGALGGGSGGKIDGVGRRRGVG